MPQAIYNISISSRRTTLHGWSSTLWDWKVERSFPGQGKLIDELKGTSDTLDEAVTNAHTHTKMYLADGLIKDNQVYPYPPT